ncbi:MAG: hypothetical protein Q9191_000012 [Dirinaria sp. TL-2023a]
MPMSEEQLEAFGRRVEAKVALHGTDFWAWWARNPHLHSQASSRSQTPTGLLTPSYDSHSIAQPTRPNSPGSRGVNLAWPSSWPHMLTPDRETPEVYEEPGEQIAAPDFDDGEDSEDGGPSDDTPDRILRSQAFRYRYFFELRWNGRRAKPAPIPGCEDDLGSPGEHPGSEGKSEIRKGKPATLTLEESADPFQADPAALLRAKDLEGNVIVEQEAEIKETGILHAEYTDTYTPLNVPHQFERLRGMLLKST